MGKGGLDLPILEIAKYIGLYYNYQVHILSIFAYQRSSSSRFPVTA